mgnify:CR=1 FL=1
MKSLYREMCQVLRMEKDGQGNILYILKLQYMIKEKEAPYKISFKFHRSTRRKFDYINPAQTVQDLMVKYNWIEDDNCNYIIPYFEEYEYNKEKPGVTIKVL